MHIAGSVRLRLCGLSGMLALSIVLGACSSPGVAPALPGATTASSDSALAASEWELVQWAGHVLPQDSGGSPVVLRFSGADAARTVSGRAGCNRFTASYSTRAAGQIEIGSAATTRMACATPLMQFEAAYLAALQTVRGVDVNGAALILRDARGQQYYRARTQARDVVPTAVPAAAPTAVPTAVPAAIVATPQVKELYVAPVQAACTGVAPMQCLQVREQKGQPWTFWYDAIDGFAFKTGTAYRIRIVGTPVANPPADGSSMRWTLERILEQHRAGPRLRSKPAPEKK